MAKIKIDNDLYRRVTEMARRAGYSSTDEFIVHVLEREVAVLDDAESEDQIEERLRGLGYIE